MRIRFSYEKKSYFSIFFQLLVIVCMVFGTASPVFAQDVVATETPTQEVTEAPTEEPTMVVPTEEPTLEPTMEPTIEPTLEPTEEPTLTATDIPATETPETTPEVGELAVPANDNIANATVITAGQTITQSTDGATLESPEPADPDYSCGASATGSVWFKFTPSQSGIYLLDVFGSSYSLKNKILEQNGSSYSLDACSGDFGYSSYQSYGSSISFYAATGKTYYIAASSSSSGSLKINLQKVACPSDALCITMTDHQGKIANNVEVGIINSSNQFVMNDWGDDSGYVEISGLDPGKYKVIASNNYYINAGDYVSINNVQVPGYLSATTKGLPSITVTVKNTSGEAGEGSVFLTDPDSSYTSRELGYVLSGYGDTIYATPGSYSLMFSGDGLAIKKDGITVPSSGSSNIALDTSMMDFETFTFADTGGAKGGLVIPFSVDWNMLVDSDNNNVLTLAFPIGTQFDLPGFFRQRASNGLDWIYWLDGTLISETFEGGGKNTNLQIGGTLSVNPDLSLSVIGAGKKSDVSAGLRDQFGHTINQIYYWGNTSTASISIIKTKNGFQTITVDPSTKEIIQSQDYVSDYVSPTFQLKNPSGTIIPTTFSPYSSYSDGVASDFSFTVPASAVTGTWSVEASVDTGPYQGTVTGSSTLEVLAPVANDNISAAKTITLNSSGIYTDSIDTRASTIETNEPYRGGNYDTTGSVWYKFTPSTTGIYTLDTHGTTYDHAIEVLKNDTARTLVTYYDTGNDLSLDGSYLDGTPISFYVTAGQTYLIGFADWSGGGTLDFQLKKITCPAGALCVSSTGDGKWSEAYTNVRVLDSNNNFIGESWGDGKGYTVVTDIPAGTYKVITSSWGFFIVTNNVKIPGILPITADNSPIVNVDMKDKSGNPINVDEMYLSFALDAFNYVHPYGDVDALAFHVTPGTYNVQASNVDSKIILAKTDVAVAANGTISLDASNMPTEDYTINLDGIEKVNYQQHMPGTNNWTNWIPLKSGETVTVGMPLGYVFRPEFVVEKTDTSGNNWQYNFSIDDLTFAADNDLNLTLGGALSVIPYTKGTPYRLGDEVGHIGTELKDSHDFWVAYFSKNGLSQGSEVSISDSSNNYVGGSDLSDIWSMYDFEIPSDHPAGTWHATVNIDTGPYQEIVNGITDFEVYDSTTHPASSNDVISGAVDITSLPFAVSDVDTMGNTTDETDPKVGECGIGQGLASTWYAYTPSQDGKYLVNTRGSDFDTILAVWENTSTGLSLVGCNDDLRTGPNDYDNNSEVPVDLAAGVPYYFEVVEYAEAPEAASASKKDGIGAQSIGGSLSLNVSQEANCYSLTTSVNLPVGGTVQVAPKGNCLGTEYVEGTVLSAQVTTKAGYAFSKWNSGSTDNPLYFAIDDNKSIEAILEVNPGLPVLLTPAANLLVADYSPTLDWSDPTPGADHYQLQVADNAAFTSPTFDKADISTSTYSALSLDPNKTYYWRVRALSESGAASSTWTTARTFKTKMLAPALASPADGETVLTTRPTFTWGTVAGATNYTLQISQNSSFAIPVQTYTSTSASFTPTADLVHGVTFYWRVKANGANPSDYSAGRSFQSANPPSVPVLASPIANSLVSDYKPTLSWKTGVGTTVTAAKYEIELANNASFTSNESIIEIDPAALSYTFATDLASNKTWYWRVRSVDASGGYSLWSSASTFRTKMLPPVLSTPADGDSVLTTRPTFTWEAVTGATGYSVQISQNSTFAIPVQTYTSTKATFVPAADLARGVTLYWRVKANGTNASDYSADWSFLSANPPAVPVLASPATGVLITGYQPTLTWKAGLGTIATVKYEIEIATNAAFTSDESIIEVDPAALSYTFTTDLASNKTWYWRVRSVDDSGGYSLWTAARTFRTKMLPPVLTAPADGDSVLTTRPTFTWGAVTGATGYSIQVSQNSTFATPVQTYTSTSASFTPTADLARGVTLYWRVKANGTNASDYSAGWSFISANPPAIPVLASPATGVLITNYKPTLTWNAGVGTITTAKYEIEIATNAAFTSDESIIEIDPAALSYTFTTDLASNKTWYWRVRSVDDLGEYSLWSAARTFRTKMLPPVLSTPVDGDSVLTTRPTFTWGSVTGATNYSVQISQNITFATPVQTYTSTSASFTPTADLARGVTLYWRVKANGTNASDYSDGWSFISANPPAVPVLVSPAAGVIISGYQPTLTWKAGVGTIAAVKYEVELATNAAFTSDESIIEIDPAALSYTFTSDLASDNIWYWRVRSFAADDVYSLWSDTRSFKTLVNIPELTSPSDGTIGVSLQPTFEWKDVSGATSYTLQVSKTESFASFVLNKTVTPSQYVATANLPAQTLLYWRVKAAGKNGPSAWSEVYQFNTGSLTLPRSQTLYFNGQQWGTIVCWNPYNNGCNNAMAIAEQDNARVTMFETPYIFNMMDGKQYPLLADGDYSWNTDRTQITFTINPAARWSDGTAVTAYDVAYTWATHVKYQDSIYLSFKNYIDGITAQDSSTVVVSAVTGDDGKAINSLMVQSYLSYSYVMQKAWTQKVEVRSNGDRDAFLNDPGMDVVYSGPYGIYSSDASEVVMVRNDNYWGKDSSMWGKLPTPKYLAHVIYSDNDAGIAAIKAGEVDISQQFVPNVQDLWNVDHLPISTYLAEDPYQVGASLPTAFFNLGSYGLDQVAVRKSIAIAVDYDGIRSNSMTNQSASFTDIPRSLMNPTPGEQALFDHDAVKDLQWAGNDIAGAKKLLDDAGIKDTDGDGYREYNGEKLQYVATCPNGWDDWKGAINYIAAAGQAIGIDITTNFPEWSDYQNVVTNWPLADGYDIFMMWTDGSGPTEPWGRVRQLMSSEFAETTGNWNGNYGGYKNSTADALINAIPSMTNAADIKNAYTQLTEIYLTDIPSFAVMYRPQSFETVNESVWTNFPHDSDGTSPSVPPLDLTDGYSIAGLYNLTLNTK